MDKCTNTPFGEDANVFLKQACAIFCVFAHVNIDACEEPPYMRNRNDSNLRIQLAVHNSDQNLCRPNMWHEISF